MRLAEQQQTKGLVAVSSVLEPDVAADDGLDALSPRLLVELDHAEHVGKIGERKRGHAVLRCRLDCLIEAHDAIHDRVLTVQSQVDE